MKQIPFQILFLVRAHSTQACAYLNANYRTVDDGYFYRSGQMHAGSLERRLKQHDIQTVISLRSASLDEEWYHDELAVCDALGVAHYNLAQSKNLLPPPDSLQEYICIVENGGAPILAHRQSGIHRSRVAAAAYLFMHGGEVEEARDGDN